MKGAARAAGGVRPMLRLRLLPTMELRVPSCEFRVLRPYSRVRNSCSCLVDEIETRNPKLEISNSQRKVQMSRSSKKGPYVDLRLLGRVEGLNRANDKRVLKA